MSTCPTMTTPHHDNAGRSFQRSTRPDAWGARATITESPADYLAHDLLPWLAPVAERASWLRGAGFQLQAHPRTRAVLKTLSDQGSVEAATVLSNLCPDSTSVPHPKAHVPFSLGLMVSLAGVAGVIVGWLGCLAHGIA